MEPEEIKEDQPAEKMSFWDVWKTIGIIGYMLPVLLIGGFALLFFGYAAIRIIKSLF
jgi:hypothetical protein